MGVGVSHSLGKGGLQIRTEGNNGSPLCENYGCMFQNNGWFTGDVPSTMGSTWTIAAWVMEASTSGLIFEVTVGFPIIKENE